MANLQATESTESGGRALKFGVAVLVIAALVVGGFLVLDPLGSRAPAAPADPTADPSVATVRRGDFVVSLRSDRARYQAGDPIQISATLAYVGDAASIEIAHGSKPMSFGIVEPVNGLQLSSGGLAVCSGSTLQRGLPVQQSFAKGGGFTNDDPRAADWLAFMQDPVLRLPTGTWHPYVVADFNVGECGAGDDGFRASIEIVVDDVDGDAPDPTAIPDWVAPVYGGDDIGNMTLQLKAEHGAYEAGKPIAIDAWYTFADGPPLAAEPFDEVVAYSIAQQDPAATEVRSSGADDQCAELVIGSGHERHVPITDANVVGISAANWPPETEAQLRRGVLQLPVGRWRISLVVDARFGGCGHPTETWETHAAVEFDVVERLE